MKWTCAICHSMHGGEAPNLLRSVGGSNELCLSCHKEKLTAGLAHGKLTRHAQSPILNAEQRAVVEKWRNPVGPNGELLLRLLPSRAWRREGLLPPRRTAALRGNVRRMPIRRRSLWSAQHTICGPVTRGRPTPRECRQWMPACAARATSLMARLANLRQRRAILPASAPPAIVPTNAASGCPPRASTIRRLPVGPATIRMTGSSETSWSRIRGPCACVATRPKPLNS